MDLAGVASNLGAAPISAWAWVQVVPTWRGMVALDYFTLKGCPFDSPRRVIAKGAPRLGGAPSAMTRRRRAATLGLKDAR